MNDTLAYLASFARFPRALRAFLARPLTLERARAIVADRFNYRESNFLRIVERSIYNHPASPSLKLHNVQSTIDFLVQANVLPAGTRSMQVVADFSYLNAVLDEIGRVH